MGQQLHGAEQLAASKTMGQQLRGCRLGRRVPEGAVFSMSRRWPRTWCDSRGLRVVALCSLGCGQLGRAALQLGSKQWYVGAVAPEGGLGGSRRARRSGGSRGGGSEISATSGLFDLGRVGDKVALGVGRRRVRCRFWREVLWNAGLFTFARASRVCSSYSSRGVFSLAVLGDRLVLWSESLFVLCLYGWRLWWLCLVFDGSCCDHVIL
jgi:hypothetical protein